MIIMYFYKLKKLQKTLFMLINFKRTFNETFLLTESHVDTTQRNRDSNEFS